MYRSQKCFVLLQIVSARVTNLHKDRKHCSFGLNWKKEGCDIVCSQLKWNSAIKRNGVNFCEFFWLEIIFANRRRIREIRENSRKFHATRWSCCTCGTHFSTILWRSLPNDNVKFPNLRFKRQREHTTVNLLFSTALLPVYLQCALSIIMDACILRNNNHKIVDNSQMFFKWRFRCNCRRGCWLIREFKIWRRQRQRQRHKSMIWLGEWRKIIVPHVQHAFWCNVLT